MMLFMAMMLSAPTTSEDFFESNVRPVLVDSCVRCHGAQKASGGLRLDSREAMLRGGDSGPAIVPGKSESSLLMKAVRRHEDVSAMPPDKPLRAEAVTSLDRWVKEGAVWPSKAAPISAAKHWAFEPLRTPTTHSIDAMLLAKIREKDLVPAPLAERLTLIRRATYDLTGLPPAPDEIDAFVGDSSPDAYERLIERLLASPRYGEKWGRFWLDVVRYADTAGETADFPVPDAWRYRNYVIDAFNDDRPWDQFLREQLAGDLLTAKAPIEEQSKLLTATGYLAISRRFGFDVEADHFLTLEDTIDTFGKSMLGLTIACARCHDHKYDPVSAADYYALYGIFESTRYPFPGCEKTKTPRDLVPLKSIPNAMAYAVSEGSPHDAQIHMRGDPMSRGAAVPRRFLTVLGGQTLPANAGSGRLQLAEWLTDAKNPLTARVLVNRIWQGHFGRGLVATPNDFGTRGTPPTHPELLDFLVRSFIDSGWSVKSLHRRIMLTEAYRRSSVVDDRTHQIDPENVWLSHFSRRRLQAEEIRDALLATSGDLDPTPGGPHPFPESKSWGYTQHNPFSGVYDTNRRSVYLMTQRIKRHPFLTLFDGPDPNASTPIRQTTTVPTQALFFLNDPFVHGRADRLSYALMALPDDRTRVDWVCRLLYGRPAREIDVERTMRFLANAGDVRTAWVARLRVLFASNEFVYVD